VQHRLRWCTFKIVKAERGIELADTGEVKEDFKFDEFAEHLIATKEPRFGVLDYHYDIEGEGRREKILLLSYVPDSTNVRQKMLYGSTIETVKKELVGWHKYLQATDAADITEKNVLALFTQV